MRYDNKYRSSIKIIFAINSFPKELFIYENPDTKKEIPKWLMERSTRLRRIYAESSISSYGTLNLSEKNTYSKVEIEAFAGPIQFGT